MSTPTAFGLLSNWSVACGFTGSFASDGQMGSPAAAARLTADWSGVPSNVPFACACQPVGVISVAPPRCKAKEVLEIAVLMTKASILVPATLGAGGTVTLRIAPRGMPLSASVIPGSRCASPAVAIVSGSVIDAGAFPCQLIRAWLPSIQLIVAPGRAAATDG